MLALTSWLSLIHLGLGSRELCSVVTSTSLRILPRDRITSIHASSWNRSEVTSPSTSNIERSCCLRQFTLSEMWPRKLVVRQVLKFIPLTRTTDKERRTLSFQIIIANSTRNQKVLPSSTHFTTFLKTNQAEHRLLWFARVSKYWLRSTRASIINTLKNDSIFRPRHPFHDEGRYRGQKKYLSRIMPALGYTTYRQWAWI